MKTGTMAETERDRVAIAAAMAALARRAVRIGGVEARPDVRPETWVKEGRRAAQSRRIASLPAREWSR